MDPSIASPRTELDGFYFAYASSMDPDQMRERCPGAEPLGRALLSGWGFRMGQRGVATVVRSADDVVWGGLWSVSEFHIEVLDGFEGVEIGRFHRETVRVDRDGERVDASIYVEPFEASAPARVFQLEHILAGAAFFHLPEDYVAQVVATAEG